MLTIGVDTGGTFTDFIWRKGDQWGEYKLLSTPRNPAEAVLAGLRHIAGEKAVDLVHGSTVATNAILEKKGALTALVSNRGFEDVIEIGRQNRPRLYDLACRRNPPLVPGGLRFGLSGRIDNTGREMEPLSDEDLAALGEKLRDAQVESIAVCLLFSFANPRHELQVQKALEPLGIPVSLSHQTLSEFREYERASTTVINAYVSPKMRRYLTFLSEQIGSSRFRIMQSNGGSISAATAMQESVRTILSGPAGGAVGALEIGRQSGFERLITFDMGGTSTDVCLIDGQLPLTTEAQIADYPVKVPMIDIHTVGAGGGSLATIDTGGSLQVGPESAGADPGPICYGRGAGITVTDANLYLGRMVADHFLGGGMQLQSGRLQEPFRQLAEQLGIGTHELAEGVLDIANTTMERAIKVISVERGFDPREFTLFSFGGAGGMHAAFLARLLQIPRVLIPRNPGILSACGMLMADVIKDYSQTIMRPADGLNPNEAEQLFQPLERRGEEELAAEGVAAGRTVHQRYLDMRYRGQSFELMVPFSADFVAAFHRQHERTYGYANPDKQVEVVNVRLRSLGRPRQQSLPEIETGGSEPSAAAILSRHKVVFDGVEAATGIIDREKLRAGNRIPGPCIIIEYSSTIVVPPFAVATVDKFGNLLLEIEA
ncbi:hydantoinase/oxoprolinase family protein [Geothermobacter hydrogeniphilus]|uniref:5-oxoprolinase n=1 Tax=Geothermobacter hydrogeniphilus TaxID=1969733 RepID=A0A1X0YCW0_9BACT|nr:hydantoinase/oxoprolinase family protein [Geothermobacter hydrogeniphilus]ORJ62967.1 5-oxoprolinase [Geothermobacter hydrogeniphilus]